MSSRPSHFNSIFGSSGGPIPVLQQLLKPEEHISKIGRLSRHVKQASLARPMAVSGLEIINPTTEKLHSAHLKFQSITCLKFTLREKSRQAKNIRTRINHLLQSLEIVLIYFPNLDRLILEIDMQWPNESSVMRRLMSDIDSNFSSSMDTAPVWKAIHTFDCINRYSGVAFYALANYRGNRDRVTMRFPLEHYAFQGGWSGTMDLEHLRNLKTLCVNVQATHPIVLTPPSSNLMALFANEWMDILPFNTRHLEIVILKTFANESIWQWRLVKCKFFSIKFITQEFIPRSQQETGSMYFNNGLEDVVEFLKVDFDQEFEWLWNNIWTRITHCVVLQHLWIKVFPDEFEFQQIADFLLSTTTLKSITFEFEYSRPDHEFKEMNINKIDQFFAINGGDSNTGGNTAFDPVFSQFQLQLLKLRELCVQKHIEFYMVFQVHLRHTMYRGDLEDPEFDRYLKSRNIFQHIDYC